MKQICNFCTSQQDDGKGGVQCGMPKYKYNGGYGPFKQGCLCVHDDDLIDGFAQRTGEEINIRNLSAAKKRDYDTILKLNVEIQELKRRLTKVDA